MNTCYSPSGNCLRSIDHTIPSETNSTKAYAELIGTLFIVPENFQYEHRGDIELWQAMEKYLAAGSPAKDAHAFRTQLEAAFLNLTGEPIEREEDFLNSKFATSKGMSSGYISPKFWREEGLPFLITQFENQASTSLKKQKSNCTIL